MQPITVYLGLGANVGDPIQQLIEARSALYALDGSVSGRCSHFYLSSPVGYSEQADFINCVIELESRLSAGDFLAATQMIESDLGRERFADNQNAPRSIDIDILLFGDKVINTERLSVPHPRMSKRLFVLAPLAEFAENNERLKQYAYNPNDAQFSGQRIHRLSIA